MARLMPPLNALRAFEAAARHMNFINAANELSVTPSAVSHQVKSLEDWAGLPLFRREGRGIVLTEAAQKFLPSISSAMDQIALAARKLRAADPGLGWLTVAMMPSFAAKWLVPRLPAFRAAHPAIDIWIATFESQSGALAPEVDVAVRYGKGDWPGLVATKVLSEDIYPVCAPDLAVRLKSPDDLAAVTLLHDELREDWAMWLAAAGVSWIDSHRGPGFDDSGLLIQAAVEGLGVALGRSALVEDDLADGRLARPFALGLPAASGYYLVHPAGAEIQPKVKAFRDWMLAEAAA
jgi:LysR family transcriptional regulator, glycine cleavage system transcriptional activator